MKADREEVARRLGLLLRGRAPESAFMEWLSRIEIGLAEVPAEDATLVSALINLFEDASIDNTRKLAIARHYLLCLETRLDNEAIAELLPLVFSQDRLCLMVAKREAGIVDQRDFVAFIRKARLPASVSAWLLRATPESLSYLCRQIASGDYEEVLGLVRT
jgi:hypothetical protein